MPHIMLADNNSHKENFATPALSMSIISKSAMIAIIREDEDDTKEEDGDGDDEDEDEYGEDYYATVLN